MKINKQFIFVLLFIFCATISESQVQSNLNKKNSTARTDLKTAFDQALINLTFTAKDSGHSIEVLVKNRTSNALSLFVPKDSTKFTETIMIVSSTRKNIDVPANGKASFIISQSLGQSHIIKGSVSIQRDVPKSQQ